MRQPQGWFFREQRDPQAGVVLACFPPLELRLADVYERHRGRQRTSGDSGMPVAALYDIHANLPALEAVLEQIRPLDVDRIVIGGDVLPGPMPAETIELLLSLEIPVQFVSGNGDRAVLAEMIGGQTEPLPEQVRDAVRWVAGQLSSGR